MAYKSALILAAFALVLHVGFSTPIETEKLTEEATKPDYFSTFLNRQLSLVNTDDTNMLCFRSRFPAANLDEYVFERYNEEQHKQEAEWTSSKMQFDVLTGVRRRAQTTGNICSSTFLEYCLAHSLPKDWANGASMNNVDTQNILARRVFAVNYPDSCKDEVVKNYVNSVKSVFKVEDISRDSVDAQDLHITMLRCTPLKFE